MGVLNGLVTVSGPNTSTSAAQARFYTRAEGQNVLSASAACISFGSSNGVHQELNGNAVKDATVVLAPASLFWPFLPNVSRSELSRALSRLSREGSLTSVLQAPPEASRLQIALQLPTGNIGAAPVLALHGSNSNNKTTPGLATLPCTLHSFMVIPAAASALSSLLCDLHNASGSTEWNYAWGLGSVAPPTTSTLGNKKSNGQQHIPTPSIISACVAVLQINQPVPGHLALPSGAPLSMTPAHKDKPCSGGLYPGCSVMVVGSPFGCLAPHHFTNSCMQGVVSMIPGFPAMHHDSLTQTASPDTQPATSHASPDEPVLFTVDAPCLPGMEGGLVYACDAPQPQPGQQQATSSTLAQAHPVLGVLCLPVSRTSDGVQIQVALSWRHVVAALLQHPLLGVHPPAALKPAKPIPADTPASGSTSPYSSSPETGSPYIHRAAHAYRHHQHHHQLHHYQHLSAAAHSPSPAAAHATVLEGVGAQVVSNATSVQAKMHMPPPGLSLPGVAGALPGVVLIRTQVSWATGVIISPGGLLLTNAHLLLPGAASGQKARAALRHAASMHAAQQHTRGVQPGGHCSAPAPRLCTRDNTACVVEGDVAGGSWMEADVTDGLTMQDCRFRPGLGSASRAHITRRPTSASCMVRMGGAGPHVRWCAAHVLYIFTNHLDLAVLQLQLHSDAGGEAGLHHIHLAGDPAIDLPPETTHLVKQQCRAASNHSHPVCSATGHQLSPRLTAAPRATPSGPAPEASRPSLPPRLGLGALSFQPTAAPAVHPPLSTALPGPALAPLYAPVPAWGLHSCTHRIFVVGHGLVGPAAGWPAAVTAGNVAQVVHARGRPCMLITTATVHAGASGGAVLDNQGQLVGLVTSNAKHASGHTLPNLNFCIPAAALQPIVAALLRHEQRRGEACRQVVTSNDWTSSLNVFFDVHASRQQLREELERLDIQDEEAHRVWNLEGPPPAPPWPGTAAAVAAQAMQLPSKL